MSVGTVWPLEPHTAAKHEILRRYLGAWFAILGRQNRRLVYVDGFCGPGRYTGGEPGSPLVAVEVVQTLAGKIVAKPELVFIDNDDLRIDNLKRELRYEASNVCNIHIICGEFRDKFPRVINSLVRRQQPTPPLFAFIDPFGFSGIPFDLVRRILSYKRSEAFILLNTNALRRFLEHSNHEIRLHIAETFGTSDVFDISAAKFDRLLALRELYQKQLSQHAKFVRYFEMLDSSGSTIYHLFFATNNPLGFEKMKDAMWAVDRTGAFRFSDRTDPNQMILLGPDPSGDLATILGERFRGQTQSAQVVKRWVIENTIYVPKHVTAALKYAERSGQIAVGKSKTDGSRRKRNTYPDGSMIKFRDR